MADETRKHASGGGTGGGNEEETSPAATTGTAMAPAPAPAPPLPEPAASSPTSIAAAGGGGGGDGRDAAAVEETEIPGPADAGGDRDPDDAMGAENVDAVDAAESPADDGAAPASPSPDPDPDPRTLRALAAQLEYYFSPQNLVRDAFLRDVMARWPGDGDDRGGRHYAPSTVLANFGNVRKILGGGDDVSSNARLVVEAARRSPLLDVAPPPAEGGGGDGVWGVGPRDGGGLEFIQQQQQQQQQPQSVQGVPVQAVPVPVTVPRHHAGAAPPPPPPQMMMLPVMHQPRHGVAVGLPPGAVLPRAGGGQPPQQQPQPPPSPQSRPGQRQAQGSPRSHPQQPQPQSHPQQPQSIPQQQHQYPHGMAVGVPVPMMMVYHPVGAAAVPGGQQVHQMQQMQMQMGMRMGVGYATPVPYFQYAGGGGRPIPPPPPPHPHHHPQHPQRYQHRRGGSGDGGGHGGFGHQNQNHGQGQGQNRHKNQHQNQRQHQNQHHNQNQNRQQHPNSGARADAPPSDAATSSSGGSIPGAGDADGRAHRERERLTVALREVPVGTTTEEVTAFMLESWAHVRAARTSAERERDGDDEGGGGDVEGQSRRKRPSAPPGGNGEKIVKYVVTPLHGLCRYVQLDDRVTRDEGHRLVAHLRGRELKGAEIKAKLKWDNVATHNHTNGNGKERKNRNKKESHNSNRSGAKGGGAGGGYQHPGPQPLADSDTGGSSGRSLGNKQQQRNAAHSNDGSDSEKSHRTEASSSSNKNREGGSSAPGGPKANQYSKGPYKQYPHRRNGSRDANVDARNNHSSSTSMDGGSGSGHKFNAVHQKNHGDGYGTWGKGKKNDDNVAPVPPTSSTSKAAAGKPIPPPPPPSIVCSSQFPSLGGAAGNAASASKLKHGDHSSANKKTGKSDSASPAIDETGNKGDFSVPVVEQVKQIVSDDKRVPKADRLTSYLCVKEGGYAAALLGKKETEEVKLGESTTVGKKVWEQTSADPKPFSEVSVFDDAANDSEAIEVGKISERTAQPKDNRSSKTQLPEISQVESSPPQQVQSEVETKTVAQEQSHNVTEFKEGNKSSEQVSCSHPGVVSCNDAQTPMNQSSTGLAVAPSDAPGTPVAGPKTDELRHTSPKPSTINPLPLNSPSSKADDICTNDTKSTDSFSSLSAGGHYTCSPSSSSVTSITPSTCMKASSASGFVSSTPTSMDEKTTKSLAISSPPSVWGKKATFADIVKSK